MHCCCWAIGPHTVDVGFHIHVGDEYFVFDYSGCLWCSVGIRGDDLIYSGCLWCSVGIRGDDLTVDLVPQLFCELLEDSGSFLRFLSVDRVLDRLWSMICFFLLLRLYPCVGIHILFYMDVFMSWWHGYLRCILYFRCDVLLFEFLYMSIVNYLKTWRLFLEYLLYSRDLSL